MAIRQVIARVLYSITPEKQAMLKGLLRRIVEQRVKSGGYRPMAETSTLAQFAVQDFYWPIGKIAERVGVPSDTLKTLFKPKVSYQSNTPYRTIVHYYDMEAVVRWILDEPQEGVYKPWQTYDQWLQKQTTLPLEEKPKVYEHGYAEWLEWPAEYKAHAKPKKVSYSDVKITVTPGIWVIITLPTGEDKKKKKGTNGLVLRDCDRANIELRTVTAANDSFDVVIRLYNKYVSGIYDWNLLRETVKILQRVTKEWTHVHTPKQGDFSLRFDEIVGELEAAMQPLQGSLGRTDADFDRAMLAVDNWMHVIHYDGPMLNNIHWANADQGFMYDATERAKQSRRLERLIEIAQDLATNTKLPSLTQMFHGARFSNVRRTARRILPGMFVTLAANTEQNQFETSLEDQGVEDPLMVLRDTFAVWSVVAVDEDEGDVMNIARAYDPWPGAYNCWVETKYVVHAGTHEDIEDMKNRNILKTQPALNQRPAAKKNVRQADLESRMPAET